VLSEEVCETLSDAAKMKDVSLEVTGDDGVINGVHRLLYEIIYNLCDNAIKKKILLMSMKMQFQIQAGIQYMVIRIRKAEIVLILGY